MWKCPTCGEEIDERFDSCWKCAGDAQEPAALPPARSLSWKDYPGLLLASTLPPVVAAFVQAFCYSRPAAESKALLYYSGSSFLWLVLASEWLVTFGIFFGLRRWLSWRAESWVIFAACCILWLLVAFFLLTPATCKALAVNNRANHGIAAYAELHHSVPRHQRLGTAEFFRSGEPSAVIDKLTAPD